MTLTRTQRKALQEVAAHRVMRHIDGGTILVYHNTQLVKSEVRSNTLDALERAGLVTTIRVSTKHYTYALTDAGQMTMKDAA